MYAFIGEVLKFFKRQFLFCSLFIILICLLAVTQYQYWLGDYNREGLINLKEEIALVELERQIIENDNQGLIEEKEKLISQDDQKKQTLEIQKLTDSFIEMIDKLTTNKKEEEVRVSS